MSALTNERAGCLRQSTRADASAISMLIADAGLNPPMELDHLEWKYWRQRKDWPGSRSYLWTHCDGLLAHAAIMPASCAWPGGRLRMAHVIDWVARRSSAGTGVALMKRLGHLTDALFAVGGSKYSLNILPLIGFRAYGAVTGYVRSLFPLRLLTQAHRNTSWKLLPRLARNTMWALTAPDSQPGEWSTRRLDVNEVYQIHTVLPKPMKGLAILERTEAFFRYALTCPIVRTQLYALERAGRVRGYFLLAFVTGQVRIADCWVDSQDSEEWRALIRCAVQEAKHGNHIVEIATWANDPLLARSLIENGFHARFTLPAFVRCEGGAMPAELMRIQMVDNDAFYLMEGRSPLWA